LAVVDDDALECIESANPATVDLCAGLCAQNAIRAADAPAMSTTGP